MQVIHKTQPKRTIQQTELNSQKRVHFSCTLNNYEGIHVGKVIHQIMQSFLEEIYIGGLIQFEVVNT